MDIRYTRRKRHRGNVVFTSLIFLFILTGTLRLCVNKTLLESRQTSLFIQETQAYYLSENLMALGRDYVYQMMQNPRETNIFLGTTAFYDKDKSITANGIIDFNGSLSKQQIVPDDFSLQIKDNSWSIKGGPVFWQSNNKNINDERYLSEIYLIGKFDVNSAFMNDWTYRMVQTIEIERNPLCDFSLYAEGDLAIRVQNVTDTTFEKPVQINGNARYYRIHTQDQTKGFGRSTSNFNIAGHFLRINENDTTSTFSSIKIPDKYCLSDNSSFYDNFKNPYLPKSTGKYYSTFHLLDKEFLDYYSNATNPAYKNYEHYIYKTFKGKFLTRSRIYRPCGFDPENDWGYWWPIEDGGKSANARLLDYVTGMHNLTDSSKVSSSRIFTNRIGTIKTAFSSLRGLNEYQLTEKARLVEMQKLCNHPHLQLKLLISFSESTGISTTVDTFYTRYGLSCCKSAENNTFAPNTIFHPAKDNIFISRYYALINQKKYIYDASMRYSEDEGVAFYKTNENNIPTASNNIESNYYFNKIENGKLCCHTKSKDPTYTGEVYYNTTYNITPTSSTDINFGPHKLVESTENYNHWEPDATATPVVPDSNTPIFMYDRNRAKWIQIIDIDVAKLCNISSDNWKIYNHTLAVNTYWVGANLGPRNYTVGTNDIRKNYITNRTNETSFTPKNTNVIDIGVRLINASKIPTGGLTIWCPYPLYIKGDFNTTDTQPAFIVTDSLTVLTNSWADWRSMVDPYDSYFNNMTGLYSYRSQTPPTIKAHVMTGRTHPNYWLTSDKSKISPDGGHREAIRTLEPMNDVIPLYGSLLLPYYCKEQWEPPINFQKWETAGFYPCCLELHSLDTKIPAGMTFYHKVNRGRKTQAIGPTTYSILEGSTLWSKDWSNISNVFSSYHNALPNYLKYETAP